MRCSKAWRTERTSISSTPSIYAPPTPLISSPRPTMPDRFRPLSAATTSPAPNSIRRRARRKASPSWNASSNGGREENRVILFPAIDLKDGRCVRLRQGDMAQATIFNEDAAAQATTFEAQGFEWLHVVDLNGAFAGRSVNAPAIVGILDAIKMPVQLGGGIRDFAAIASWLDAGVRRVILGTVAVRDPALVKQAAKSFPGRIAVGIDARDGMVAVEGWAQASSLSATELARRFEDEGVAAIIFTDIARDGMLQGVNVAATAALSRAVSIPIIASGGVSGVADIRQLIDSGAPIAGAVIGRALYDGRINPAEALFAARR